MGPFEILKRCAEFAAASFWTILNFITEIPTPPPIVLSEINFVTDTDRIVVGLLVALHVLYVFLLDSCMEWDKTDNFMHKKAIQINDAPFGVYKFLIRIYTNWRPRSGTRSKIFIQLHGNLGQNTICYFLHNPFLPYRQLFVWGDCSFFVINTANPVGEIQVSTRPLRPLGFDGESKIPLNCRFLAFQSFDAAQALTIGHDDSVDSSWFLSKVLVKDLQMNKCASFNRRPRRHLSVANSRLSSKGVPILRTLLAAEGREELRRAALLRDPQAGRSVLR